MTACRHGKAGLGAVAAAAAAAVAAADVAAVVVAVVAGRNYTGSLGSYLGTLAGDCTRVGQEYMHSHSVPAAG